MTGNLGMRCASCGFDNPQGMKFCGQCGTVLHRGAEAERRQLTVLFCDLVESTALAERLDPEDLREVVREYQAASGAAIERFGGHIAQYLGDGLLVYFGYPHAHEDDARRAVHAGLGIVAAVRELSERLAGERGIRLAVRVGIHTGPVVAGEVGTGPIREHLAMGETPAVAARLQGIAQPDTVVVSGAVHRLVQGFFAWQRLGPQSLKGLRRAIDVYRAVGESAAQSRFEIAVSRGLSPPVGRRRELELLRERLAVVRDGRGQVVLLTGGAGIGKSRLIHMFREEMASEPAVWLMARCSAYHQQSAFHPITDLVQRVLGIRPDDEPASRLARLEQGLGPFGFDTREVVPLFAGLLGIPLSGDYAPADLAPQREKEKLKDNLLEILFRLTARDSVVFVVEDLHWVDPSTVELLAGLMQRIPQERVLAVLTYRPSYACPWAPDGYVTQLSLDRLGKADVKRLACGVASGKALPPEVLEHVAQKTDGVPLFVEELTKMVIETGLVQERPDRYELAGPLPEVAIPATLSDSLMARLDRLGAAKEVAQVGAVIGREFPYDMLRAVWRGEEAALRTALTQLGEAQLLYHRGEPSAETFSFKHALIQDAAYGSLLKSTRQEYHARIADTLATTFAERVALRPELLAHHYTQAGRPEPAVAYWLEAGQRAIERSANREAIDHLTRGLALLTAFPASPERDQRELAYQIALGGAWTASRGYAAPEVQEAFTRALALCEGLGEAPQLIWVIFGLWTFYVTCGQFHQALELGRRLLRLAESQEDTDLLLQAHFAVGLSQLQLGELAAAREHFERGVALDVTGRQRTRPAVEAADAGVTIRSFLAFVLWMMGEADRAVRLNDEAMALAEELAHPFSKAYALVLATWIRRFRRETEAVQRLAEEGRRLSEEKGFLYLQLLSGFLLASTRADGPRNTADAAAAVRPMQEAFEALMGIGARFGETLMRAVLAEGCLRQGLWADAEHHVALGLAAAEETGERYWIPELRRLRGELAARGGDRAAAEHELAAALQRARQGNSPAFALRAATALARLAGRTGHAAEMRAVLSEAVSRVSDGGGMADLEAARAVLAELA